jgi:hypothetical protein
MQGHIKDLHHSHEPSMTRPATDRSYNEFRAVLGTKICSLSCQRRAQRYWLECASRRWTRRSQHSCDPNAGSACVPRWAIAFDAARHLMPSGSNRSFLRNAERRSGRSGVWFRSTPSEASTLRWRFYLSRVALHFPAARSCPGPRPSSRDITSIWLVELVSSSGPPSYRVLRYWRAAWGGQVSSNCSLR